MTLDNGLMRHSLDKRVRDENGHMHVSGSCITRGLVSNYLASEVEGATERGYRHSDLIPIYRDPGELSKAVDSFRDIPLLRRHVMVSADEPQKEDIVGVVTNPHMVGDDMYGDLTFWSAQDGIDPVLARDQDELSCGYVRDLDWTPGEVNGLHYAARMVNIRGNHCAIVDRGRVPGARVADQQPAEFSMSYKFPRLITALQAALGLKPEQAAAVDSALTAEVAEKLEAPATVEKTPEQIAAEAAEAAAQDAAAKQAADEAQVNAIKAAVDAAVAETEKRIHSLYAAREAVASKVGVTSLDSAESTYRFALEKSGVTHTGIAADALPALWEATLKVSEKPASVDAAPDAEFDMTKLFPGLSLIRKG